MHPITAALTFWSRAWCAIRRVVNDHELVVALSLALLAFSLRALSDLTFAPASIQELPDWLTVTYCILAGLSGGGVIVSLYGLDRWDWSGGTYQAALYLGAAAWLCYTVGLSSSPVSVRSFLLLTALSAISVGYILTARRFAKIEHDKLRVLRYTQKLQAER